MGFFKVTLKQEYSDLRKCFLPITSFDSALWGRKHRGWFTFSRRNKMFNLTILELHWKHKAIQIYLRLCSVYYVCKSQTVINFRVLWLFLILRGINILYFLPSSH